MASWTEANWGPCGTDCLRKSGRRGRKFLLSILMGSDIEESRALILDSNLIFSNEINQEAKLTWHSQHPEGAERNKPRAGRRTGIPWKNVIVAGSPPRSKRRPLKIAEKQLFSKIYSLV